VTDAAPPAPDRLGAGARVARFRSIAAAGSDDSLTRAVAEEMPVAIELNGIGYAVLMCTPTALDDLAYGFVRAERLVQGAGEIRAIDRHDTPDGVLLRITLNDAGAARVQDRVRHRVSESSCGLCGIENLEQTVRPLPPLTSPREPDAQAIFRALETVRDHQPLQRATGGVHAAAACSATGEIRLIREDVGRHNAFDKLIGAMMRAPLDWDGGFALLTSRCSFELVEKAVLAQCPALVTISAATGLALSRAVQAGLPLRVLARRDTILAPDRP
jgi:FdhD protein